MRGRCARLSSRGVGLAGAVLILAVLAGFGCRSRAPVGKESAAGPAKPALADSSKHASAEAKGGVKMRLWVPAYYYPNGPGLQQWQRLLEGARRAPVVAIVNPNSGPGDKVDTNYAAVTRRARQAGVTLVGYVGTQYTRKSLADVQAEVDRFVQFYPDVQGIHVDEQASDAGKVGYYADLYNYVRRKIPEALVLSNPGTDCAEDYVSRPAADAICLFERDTGFESFSPPDWPGRYSPDRFAVQAYQVDAAAKMEEYLQHAVRQRVGYVYITDARGANPYDRLPSYWDAEVAAVERLNRQAP